MRDYQVKPIQALERGLRVLQALREMRAASLHDLHRVTGIPKPTLTRILLTCYQQGLVWPRMADGAFMPTHIHQGRTGYDDAGLLGEIASPVLERLCETVMWPSVLTVPRLDYMETIETNSPRAYFDEVAPVSPIGFRSHMLRGASGRAYLAYCPEREREAVLRRLREHDIPGNELAHDTRWVRNLVGRTRARGYSVRAADYGGDYARTRAEVDDGRDSIAVPIRLHGQVLGCVNLTWRKPVMTATRAAERHLDALVGAAHAIAERVAEHTGTPGTAPAPAATTRTPPAHVPR
jgi:IclR family transcriptional regulator, mhp operon transcriptional activator